MKIWELASGILTPLSEEEDELLCKLIKNNNIQLSEREEIVAQKLVHKDVLIREEHKNGDKFIVNFKTDVWRD